MQNNMIKYFPSDEVWLEHLEQKLSASEDNQIIRFEPKSHKNLNSEILAYLE
jgi:hypothetical protein